MTPVERLAWSTGHMIAGAGRALRRGLGLGLGLAVIAAAIWGLGESLDFVVAVFLANLVAYAGLFSLALIALGGLIGAAPARRVIPNQGVRDSARNFALVAGLLALALALPLTLLTALLGAPSPALGDVDALRMRTPAARAAIERWSADPTRFALGVELCVALTLGYVAGLLRGGFAALQHVVLRLLLAARERVPLRLVPTLEAARERALLRRIGGGYRFVHATLLEHLADAPPDAP